MKCKQIVGDLSGDVCVLADMLIRWFFSHGKTRALPDHSFDASNKERKTLSQYFSY
eukprot:m.75090 g.75090  ORF g.75090 m.75090 type:complete len:56 (-) comp13120_c2_seq2:80-247(-)